MLKANGSLRSMLFLMIIAFAPPGQALLADAPRVKFDVARLVVCREVWVPEMVETHPHEKLVQATFDISALLEGGKEADIDQFFYRIVSPEATLCVVDHLPRTEMTSSVAGRIAIEKKDEDDARLGGDLGGEYAPFAKANLNASIGGKSGVTVKYELLPKLDLLAASGTFNRASGVFYKLKPSPQTSLEGARQFVVVFRVPISWRGECVRVECRATGFDRGVIGAFDQKESCGARTFHVGLYLAGDSTARTAVAEFIDAEDRLAAALRRHARRAHDALSRSSVLDLSDVFTDSASPPEQLRARLLAHSLPEVRRMNELPEEVRQTVEVWAAAKLQLAGLNVYPRTK